MSPPEFVDLRALLTAWDHVVRAEVSAPDRLVASARRAKSVLRAGASEEALLRAEEQLGVALPASYREFLSLTDGAYADSFGAVTEALARVGEGGELGFLPASELRWITDHPLGVVVAALTEQPEEALPLDRDGGMVRDLRALRSGRVLIVSTVRESQFTGLVPGDGGEWELWRFSRDEIVGYSSFASWLHDAASSPVASQVMDLIRWRRDGDPRGDALGKVRDPAALPVLHAAIQEFPDDYRVVLGVLWALSRIRSSASVELVEPYVAPSPTKQLAIRTLLAIGTPAARDALARHGAHYQLLQLHDERAVEAAINALEAGNFFATSTMSTLRDQRFLPALRRAWARTDDRKKRFALAATLHVCGGDDGTAHLREVCADPNHDLATRERACELLNEGGGEDDRDDG